MFCSRRPSYFLDIHFVLANDVVHSCCIFGACASLFHRCFAFRNINHTPHRFASHSSLHSSGADITYASSFVLIYFSHACLLLGVFGVLPKVYCLTVRLYLRFIFRFNFHAFLYFLYICAQYGTSQYSEITSTLLHARILLHNFLANALN